MLNPVWGHKRDNTYVISRQPPLFVPGSTVMTLQASTINADVTEADPRKLLREGPHLMNQKCQI